MMLNDDNYDRAMFSEMLYAPSDSPRPASLFTVQKFFLRLMGLFSTDHLSSWLPTRLRKIQAFLVVFITGHIALLFIKTTLDALEENDLEDITDALMSAIIYAFSCFSASYWLWRSQKLKEFLHRIDRGHRHHSLAGLTFVSSQRAFVLARTLTMTWLASCYSGVVLWGLAPIILRSHTLPLKCWYPFNEMQSGIYEFVYATQLLGQVLVGTAFGNGSALFVSLIILMMGQFDVLFCSLKNFDYYARLISGENLEELRKIQNTLLPDKDDELNQYAYATEHKTDLFLFEHLHKNKCIHSKNFMYLRLRHDALVKCVQHHRFIMDCCKELEKLFSPYCLIKSLQITVQLCLLLFVGVEGEQTVMRVINLLQYVGLTAVELLMFTYFGELLHSHSLRGGEALWRATWWPGAKHTRQVVVIFLLNSRRAVKLTAGKFFTMDVQRLQSVVTQAFSFFTLLQKLAAKDGK